MSASFGCEICRSTKSRRILKLARARRSRLTRLQDRRQPGCDLARPIADRSSSRKLRSDAGLPALATKARRASPPDERDALGAHVRLVAIGYEFAGSSLAR